MGNVSIGEGEGFFTYTTLFDVRFIEGIVIGRDLHIMEHSLQLLRKLETTLDLELREHTTLRIVGYRTAKEQPLREMGLVIPLKGVLFGDEAEDGDSFIEHKVDFFICFLGERAQVCHTVRVRGCGDIPLSSPSSGCHR